MNTPTLLGIIIVLCLLVYGFYKLLQMRSRSIREGDDEARIISNVVLIFIVLFVGFFIITTANIYGWGRLPLINEVRNRLPQDFTPNPNPVKPPTNGDVRPPSSPAMDEHSKAMEKLKKDGF